MSGTVLEHQSVQDYLHDLNGALRGMPYRKAYVLREQITVHLEEAVPPDADQEEISEVLRSFGSPADVAAEAVAAAAAGPVADVRGGTWLWCRLARVHRRSWNPGRPGRAPGRRRGGSPASLPGGGAADSRPGKQRCLGYPQDVRHEESVSLNDTYQSTVPIRSGQRQGYIIGIYNPTNVTETIVGSASGITGWTLPGASLSSSRSPPVRSTSRTASPSGTYDQLLYVRVRVGWFTRVETIPVNEIWVLKGPSSGHCT